MTDKDRRDEKPGRTDEVRAKISAAREKWIERLVDLTRRNALLYFRKSIRRSVDWIGTDGEIVADLIAGRAVSLGRIQALTNDLKVAAKLKEIRKIANAYRDERGLETLFLALGVATWNEPDQSASGTRFRRWVGPTKEDAAEPTMRPDQPRNYDQTTPPQSESQNKAAKRDEPRPPSAPVLLLPVSLETKSPTGGGELHLRRSGDMQVNPVLLFALENTFGLEIEPDDLLVAMNVNNAEQDEPGSVAGVAAAFDGLKAAARNISGFAVQDKCILSNFHFQKMAMVRDLRECGDLINANDIVAAIVGDLDARAKLASDRVIGDPSALDSIPPQDQFQVLDADASQQMVIHNIVNSETASGVIHGPPGTGKSQTITNLIASLVARGKRVLFVAEKRAALDVVLARLRATDLSHLALDLHGAEIKRASIIERLKKSYEISRRAQEPKSGQLFNRIVELRQVLNEHAARVNDVRQAVGLSLFAIEGELLRMPGLATSDVRWRSRELTTLGPEIERRASSLFEEASAFGSLFLRDRSSPWHSARFTDGLQVQHTVDVVSDLNRGTLLPDLIEAVSRCCKLHNLKVPQTLRELKAQLGAIWEVNHHLNLYRPSLFGEDLSVLVASLQPAAGTGVVRIWASLTNGRYRRASQMAKAFRTSKASAPTLLSEIRQAAASQRHWMEHCSGANVCRTDTTAVERALAPVAEAVHYLGPLLDRADLESLELSELALLVNALKVSEKDAARMLRVGQIEDELQKLGVWRVVEDIRCHPRPIELWQQCFRYAWLASHRDDIYAHDDALNGFMGDYHNKLVNEFKELDQNLFALAAQRLRSLHGDRVVRAMNQFPEQAAIVQPELAKKTRHLPLRRLMTKAEDVIMAICPCWMASPLSVSQLLEQKQCFDVVIFDEASQVLPEDAVPSLMRSRRAVVAGDEHQLPPTTFFMGADEDDDEAEELDSIAAAAAEATAGMESILAQMQGFMTPYWLNWHYRSRDERLIAFSNRHIYHDTLITFPGAGVYESINHIAVSQIPRDGEENSVGAEVDQVVSRILEHAEKLPNESLGVITMGIVHQRRIDASLEAARALRPDLDEFFDERKSEKFFVKNLERVQGDERDAIVLSVGYGKDRSGKLPYRFGPLLTEGGQRRLNVAITRAKNRLTTISSFTDSDMDPARSSARGVELLRLYLQYARSGGKNLATGEGLTKFKLNPFEADIADALENAGIPILPQWGVSGYRIDMIAKHPTKPGRFVLAIECDGASYHSWFTARDRDRLRQQHLEALGWRFHRIWSTDWFLRREDEIRKAKRAYEEAVRYADGDDGSEIPGPKSRGPDRLSQLPQGASQVAPRGPLPVPQWSTIDEYSAEQLVTVLRWIESDGVRYTREELIQQAAHVLGFERIGSKIRESLERACLTLESRRSF